MRQLEARLDAVEGEYDGVPEPDPGPVTPPWMAVEGVADRVHPVPGLADRVHLHAAATAFDGPPVAVVPDRATLHLQRDDPEPRERDEEVDLAVLPVVGHPNVGQQQVLGPCLVAQGGPHGLLAVRGKEGIVVRQAWHG